jgi:ABC-2 type transport system ATP-binding protein
MTQTVDFALDVRDLVVRYGTVSAVDGVSFQVRPGSVLVMLGRNGAGKTSTIEVCEGFRRPSSGSVRVLGLDPITQRPALNKQMGIMLQGGGIYPSARVAETIAHYCTLYGAGVNPNNIMERVGLSGLRSRTWRTLSGGEQQRLSLALALCARPKIAFLDEPTSGVDVDGRQEIRSIIRELAGEGCAVVLATHEMDEAERCADDILIMDRGKVVADGALAALQEPETRFRLSLPIATNLLCDALGSPVALDGSDYVLIGRSGTDVIAALAEVARELGASVVDVRSGTQRLETLFRRFTEGHGS